MSELNDDVTPLIFGGPKPEQAAQPEAAAAPASTDAGGEPAEAAAEVYEPVADQPTWLWPDAVDTSTEPTPDAPADEPGDPGSAGELAETVEPVESLSEPWSDTGLARSAEPVAEAEPVTPRAEASEDSAPEPVAEAEPVTPRAEASEDSAPRDGFGESAVGAETGHAAAAGDPAGGIAVADGVASPAGGEDTWPGFDGGGVDEAEDTDPYAAAVGDVDEPASEDDSAEFGAAETVTEPEFADARGAADGIPAGDELATSAGEANQTTAAEPEDEAEGTAGEFTLNLTETADEAESTYGHPEVDAVVQRLAELDQLETADHIEVYEDAHHRLHEALLAAGKDEGAAGGSPSDYA